MQYVGVYFRSLGYAITFRCECSWGVVTAMKNVIEYYVSEQFRKQSGRWITPEQRGKIISFPTPQKKSAEHETSVQRRS